jgi:hypothetical protein
MFNGSPTDFLLAPRMPAIFLWVTEDGTVQGWNPGVKPTTAVIEVDNSRVPNPTNGAVYKGATIAEIDGKKWCLNEPYGKRPRDRNLNLVLWKSSQVAP